MYRFPYGAAAIYASAHYGAYPTPSYGDLVATSGALRITATAQILGRLRALRAALSEVRPPSPPTIVQSNVDDHVGGTNFTAAFTGAQTAGNTNLVLVAWGDASEAITDLHDSSGNVYTRIGFIQNALFHTTLSVYVSVGIAAAGAGANIVSVTTDVATTFPELYIFEIAGTSGVNSSAVDSNNGATASASATSTVAECLAIGYCYNNGSASGPGVGWTLDPNSVTSFGAAAEHENVVAAGPVTADVPLTAAADWCAAVVIFAP